jgi:hypothetical protein
MIVKKNHFELIPDEEVLLELNLSQKILAKDRENMKFTIYLSLFFTSIGIILFLTANKPLGFLLVMFSLAFFLCSIMSMVYHLLKRKQIFYITNKRIIHFFGKNRFRALHHNDIAYIEDKWTKIIVVARSVNGDTYYTGDETQYIEETRKMATIKLWFKGDILGVLQLLYKTIPLKTHPILTRIYLPEKNF